MLDTTRLSKGWAYDEQLFHACGGATWKKHKSTSRKRAKYRQLRGNASFSSLPSPQSGRSIRMGVIPGMTAEHDTAGYYDSKGYCSVLERYAVQEIWLPARSMRLGIKKRQCEASMTQGE